jgi:hypothetical protein
MNLNEANGHAGGGELDGMSNGEGGLETIQEDQEPDSDQQPIEVCDLLTLILRSLHRICIIHNVPDIMCTVLFCLRVSGYDPYRFRACLTFVVFITTDFMHSWNEF